MVRAGQIPARAGPHPDHARALQQMEARLDDIDFARAAHWEAKLRHDVMAHIHTFGEAAPAAREIIHLGATSQYVVDNADLLIMRDAMRLIAGRLAVVIDALGRFALTWKDLPTLGYTHFQPAQLTTVGKRAVMWRKSSSWIWPKLSIELPNFNFGGSRGRPAPKPLSWRCSMVIIRKLRLWTSSLPKNSVFRSRFL